MTFKHESVLLEETIKYLDINPKGIYVDGTLGGGGHSEKIIEKLSEDGLLIGIDQDIEAINASKKRFKNQKKNIIYVHDNFSNIKIILQKINIEKLDGVILDLGVSSYQLDNRDRGFSYMSDAELDMRMDQKSGITAKEIVNTYSKEKLQNIIREYGEEKWAKRIADFIEKYRNKKEITTTMELVEIIKNAIPARARRDGPHPAKRTFQALRIEVNNELEILKNSIIDITDTLKVGGRICIITFHSLEDRIVKNTFKELSLSCNCPPELPVCVCNKKPSLKIITKKPILPSYEEIEINPRSRSAKLRVAERI